MGRAIIKNPIIYRYRRHPDQTQCPPSRLMARLSINVELKNIPETSPRRIKRIISLSVLNCFEVLSINEFRLFYKRVICCCFDNCNTNIFKGHPHDINHGPPPIFWDSKDSGKLNITKMILPIVIDGKLFNRVVLSQLI